MDERTFYEMVLHLQLSDREIERVLAGQQPYGRPDLGDVAHFVANLRSMAGFVPPPPMSPSLLAQLRSADGERSHAPTELHRARARRTEAELAHRRWRFVGAAAVVAMMGGVAYAGLSGASDGRSADPDAEIEEEPADTPGTTAPKDSPPETPPPTEVQPPPTEATPPPEASTPAETHTEAPSSVEPEAETTPPAWDDDWQGPCAPQDWQCWMNLFTGGGNGRPDGPPSRTP